jgi:hypothetical protein
MSNNTIPSLIQMEPALLQHLVTEVKETIATGIEMPHNAKPVSFKAINFWNIQRKGKFVNSGSARKKSKVISLSHVSF